MGSSKKTLHQPGDRVGPDAAYTVVGFLGAGGMGEVFEVERDGRRYAYKALQFRHQNNKVVLEKFKAEAAAGSEMLHPNLVRVYASGLDAKGGFILMELLDGQSLAEALRETGLTIDETLNVGIQVADALHALHVGKILHRDVKPGNIFLCSDGRVILLDLGAAKFERYGLNTTQSQGAIGTFLFMSPEHLNPDAMEVTSLDGRTDVHSLGLVLFNCLTGEHATRVGAEDTHDQAILGLRMVMNERPSVAVVAPELPAQIVKVVDRATRRLRDHRYATAAEFATALRAARSWFAAQTRAAAAANGKPAGPRAEGPQATAELPLGYADTDRESPKTEPFDMGSRVPSPLALAAPHGVTPRGTFKMQAWRDSLREPLPEPAPLASALPRRAAFTPTPQQAAQVAARAPGARPRADSPAPPVAFTPRDVVAPRPVDRVAPADIGRPRQHASPHFDDAARRPRPMWMNLLAMLGAMALVAVVAAAVIRVAGAPSSTAPAAAQPAAGVPTAGLEPVSPANVPPTPAPVVPPSADKQQAAPAPSASTATATPAAVKANATAPTGRPPSPKPASPPPKTTSTPMWIE